MTTDLSGLERAAAQLGHLGLSARLVPPDRRRGRWFRFAGRELLVSERVVERLRPEEGEALLVHAVIEKRHRRRGWERWLSVLGLTALAVWGVHSLWPSATTLALMLGLVLALVALALLRGQGSIDADDEAVVTLGDAELLVRAINTIQKDELQVGAWRGNARPDLHRRAERLVTLHQLRLPPELRTVPVIGSCTNSCHDSDESHGESDDRPHGSSKGRSHG